MNRLIINLEAINQNLRTIDGWVRDYNGRWTVVTKVLCGHVETLQALLAAGVRSIGESRLKNLEAYRKYVPDLETWYLRVPSLSSIAEVVKNCDVSLNSELSIIKAINDEARKQDKIHNVVIMIELGDLREGILPGSLVNFYERVFDLSNIRVVGIGGNLGCLAGAVPTVGQFVQLLLYRELLELKFEHRMPLISAGTTASLPLVIDKSLPRGINHFRIGEGLFLGTDLINGGSLPNLRVDTVSLAAEIIEIKKKNLVPTGETAAISPFANDDDDDYSPGQRGYRALVNVGQLDTEVEGLVPENPEHRIAGASSDITVVNLGDDPRGLKVGGEIRFRMNYAALLRLMGSDYVKKVITPPLDEFKASLDSGRRPVIEKPLAGVDISGAAVKAPTSDPQTRTQSTI